MSDISHIQIDNTLYNIKDANAARKDSPILEGLPQAPRYGSGGTITEPIATIGYVNNAFKANDAMLFKGTIGSSGASVTTLPATHEIGWTYKVATVGTYAEQECEVGDLIICTTAGTAANNAHWTVVQENINLDDVPTENSINPVKSSGIKTALDTKQDTFIKSASGAIASFDDGADGLPVVDLTVSIEPVQAGSGDPSPSNVRPITGWTGCNVIVSPTNSAQDGTTYNISFSSAGTVYGGSLDVSSGVLTVTHRLWSTNGRQPQDPTAVNTSNNITQFWLYAGGTNRTYFDGIKCDSLINNQIGGISNTFRVISTYPSSIWFYMPSSLVGTTSESINTYLNAHPMNFWVQLITPVTYQLTPTEITTFLGQNNIWADTGNVDVVYWKDSVVSEIATKYYTRTETDALLDAKADSDDVYTKTEVNTLLDTKQDTLTFDNSPTANSNNPVKSDGIKSALDTKSDIFIKSTSGPIVSFDDGAAAPAGNVTVAIEPVQEGTGDPSPENIRPITGWTGVKVMRTGKNLLVLDRGYSKNVAGVMITVNANGTITLNGTCTSNASIAIWNLSNKNSTSVNQSTSNHFPYGNYKIGSIPTNVSLQIYGSDIISSDTTNSYKIAESGLTNDFTINTYKYHYARLWIGNNATYDNVTFKPAIYFASDVDENESYNNDIYDISFDEAGTVYGGSLDVSSGMLTVTHGIVDLGTKKWTKGYRNDYDTGYIFTCRIDCLYNGNCICSAFKSLPGSAGKWETVNVNEIRLYRNISIVCSADYDTENEFKTAVSGVILYYPLATPLTYQLTPTEVTTLLGQNNIWADTGDISVVYCKNSPDGTSVGKILENINTAKQDKLIFDSTPTQESLNPVTSDGIKSALDLKTDASIMETELNNKQDNIIKVASGSIANFESDTDRNYTDVKIDIEPVQDLHGYDHPWPAGGGKNLFNAENFICVYNSEVKSITTSMDKTGIVITRTSSASFAFSNLKIFEITASNVGETYTFSCNENTIGTYKPAIVISDLNGNNRIRKSSTYTITEEDVGKLFNIVFYTSEGELQTTYTNIQVEKNFVATSYEPYSNICPIEGWTGTKVMRTGKNLFDKNHLESGKFIQSDGTIDTNSYALLSDYIFIPDGICVFSSMSNVQSGTVDSELRIGLYDANKNFIERKLSGTAVSGNYHIIKINNPSVKYVRCSIFSNADDIDTVQLELGTERTTYEPFGDTYDISFPSEAGTVYGGSLDVPSGVLTVTHRLWSTNGRSPNDPTAVSTSNNITQFWLYAGGDDRTNRTYFDDIKCDSLINNNPYGSFISNTFRVISTYPSSIWFYMPSSLVGTTRESINTYLNAHPMNFWVQLITPVTYQLTPQQIQAFLGTNNIWADTGDTTVKYWSDTAIQTYVDNMVHASSNDEYKRYGVSGVGESASALTRIYDAIGMVAQVGTDGDNSGVRNDFDYAPPFMRRKCVGNWTLEDDHAVFHVQAYYGDEGYTEDGTKGDYVAVECPRCYYLREGDKLVVSAHQYPGYRPFDIFCKNHNPQDTMPFVYLPAYALAMKDGKAVSLPGLDNEQGSYYDLVTRARTYADGAIGTKAMILPFAVNFYEYCLSTIEFAEQNPENILKGCGLIRAENDNCTFTDATHVLVNNWQTGRVVGEYVAIIGATEDRNLATRQATHRIKSITRCDSSGNTSSSGSYTKIEVEDLGKNYFNYETSTTYRFIGKPWRTGETNGVSTPSGSPVSNTDSYHPMKYRWRENIWGNQWTTSMDLFNIKEGTSDSDWTLDWYFLPNPEEYTPSSSSKPDDIELKAESPFVKLSLTTPHAKYNNGYIKSKKFSGLYPDVWIPDDTGSPASGTTYYADGAFLVSNAFVRPVHFGGCLNYGGYNGSSIFHCTIEVSETYSFFGAHLYIKQG